MLLLLSPKAEDQMYQNLSLSEHLLSGRRLVSAWGAGSVVWISMTVGLWEIKSCCNQLVHVRRVSLVHAVR